MNSDEARRQAKPSHFVDLPFTSYKLKHIETTSCNYYLCLLLWLSPSEKQLVWVLLGG